MKEFTFETEEKKTESQVQPLQVLSDYDSEKEEENALNQETFLAFHNENPDELRAHKVDSKVE